MAPINIVIKIIIMVLFIKYLSNVIGATLFIVNKIIITNKSNPSITVKTQL